MSSYFWGEPMAAPEPPATIKLNSRGCVPRPQAEATPVARRKVGTVWYAVMSNGQMIRNNPQRPYRGKAGRRAHIKARRLEKEMAL